MCGKGVVGGRDQFWRMRGWMGDWGGIMVVVGWFGGWVWSVDVGVGLAENVVYCGVFERNKGRGVGFRVRM